MSSATDELRRLLDERGVEWGNIRNDGSESDYLTEWQFENNQGKAIAIEWAVGSGLSVEIHRYQLTPEQAIDATLGRRTTTRHGKFRTKYGRSVPCCKCCGYGIGDERWHYCPSCGAEVVGE